MLYRTTLTNHREAPFLKSSHNSTYLGHQIMSPHISQTYQLLYHAIEGKFIDKCNRHYSIYSRSGSIDQILQVNEKLKSELLNVIGSMEAQL